MIRLNINRVTGFKHNESIEGETIEMKIERITENNEPISDGAPIIYTERKEGVIPGYDIRTDRFEVAIEAMDNVNRSNTAKTVEMYKKYEERTDVKNDGLDETSDNTSDSVGDSK